MDRSQTNFYYYEESRLTYYTTQKLCSKDDWQDLYNRYIVGWRVLDHMRQSLLIESFKRGWYARRPNKGLIIHTDGGEQNRSHSFRNLLCNTESLQSMTRRIITMKMQRQNRGFRDSKQSY